MRQTRFYDSFDRFGFAPRFRVRLFTLEKLRAANLDMFAAGSGRYHKPS